MNEQLSQVARPNPAISVLLASASRTRAELLRRAGVDCSAEPARIDETAVKQSMQAAGATPDAAAMALAELKAVKLSRRHGDVLVIGADQLLTAGPVWFDKPPDLAHARAQLTALRNRAHRLHSAVCVVLNGAVIWRHGEQATLTMRPFSDAFLDTYLAEIGDLALESVGAYQLEGRGAQLFAKVEGDYFAILGLPLLPLLDFLRGRGAVPT
jgi:septum formation protein